MQQLNYP